MVVGDGLIACSLHQFKEEKTLLIFASGVSNSMEKRESEYSKEKNLLLSFINTEMKLIYFSTCSIFDDSLINTKYIKHKLEIEQLIKKHFKKYLILRLPTMVGNTPNPHIFFNYFKNKIINNKELIVYGKSCRYLLDIEDVSIFLSFILKEYDENVILNVALNNPLKIEKIVHFIETILNKRAPIKILNKGSSFKINNKEFIRILKKNNYQIDNDYTYNLLKKYLKVKN